MKFWKQPQKLAEAASETKQKIKSRIDQVTTQTKRTTEAITTTSHKTLDNALDTGKEAHELAQQTTQYLTVSSWNKLQELQETAHDQSRKNYEAIRETLEAWHSKIVGLGVSGMVTANALKDLPRTVQALAQEMPKLTRRLRTAGTRLGDAPRTDADIMSLFNKIPGTSKLNTSKLGTKEKDIQNFLSQRDGSHIHPHSQGGSNGAENILWEIRSNNIRRGATSMTGNEKAYIRFYNAVDSVLKNSTTIAKLGVTATGTAVLTQALITALAHTLDLYRGDITAEEFRQKIIDAAVSAGIATPIFFLIFIVTIALFPELVVILSAPAVVAGFNTLFGIGIALPIIQSIIRHIEADGLGKETKEQYQTAIAQGEALLSESSQEVKQWWQQIFSNTPAPDSKNATAAN